MPYQLAYMSTSTPWSRPELLELLRVARAKNRSMDVTGVLLHRQGRFVQLLEGGDEEVRALYATIRADHRHRDVTLIWDDHGDTRWFADWWMAVRDLEEDPVTEPSLTDVLRGPTDASRFSHEVVLQLWTLLRDGLPERPAP
ncbi:Sensors of blue-light using FAD [Microlunatus sagamiharensis]|uniref:Sensors of blue-light using FAD n=1 Tax=Microlunatus sagamiharensis TaxID=546874 RepID=A0A1H2MAW4_9ACTN|nr:BLUF domain-containing protein [Microlunatus sagamiharensis]SDU90319.1 Sensors of blue-light using FAD [Microlunatus sagamiharensis]